ncbi:methyl-accepting chemotaxis protein [Georgenia phoenicis]|uniref:methyl-accepting chemotaxis protein n=1 Tax=unclassified Georgenia TaxID=2626815 RepID=UPI0039B0AD2D
MTTTYAPPRPQPSTAPAAPAQHPHTSVLGRMSLARKFLLVGGVYGLALVVINSIAYSGMGVIAAEVTEVVALAAQDGVDLSGVAEQASATAGRYSTLITVLGLIALAAGTTLLRLTGRSIRSTIRGVHHSLEALAQGDLTVTAPVTSRDEIGQMAQALGTAQGSLRTLLAEVGGATRTVAAAAEQLAAGSEQMNAGLSHTASLSGTVAAAAEQVSTNVRTAAAGSEQMGSSIREIAQNAEEAARVAARAAEVAEGTTTAVVRLGGSSQEIGEVVKVITSIADQTDLLALNATIEAARAGEAGKGFAVVAGEVKELAQQTARATEDIARRVEAIQGDTGSAADAMREIADIVGAINQRQLTIASAVEEQTATTQEITRSISEAAAGTGEIAVNITAVAGDAREAVGTVSEIGQSVTELARMSAELQRRVDQFRY